MIKCALRIFLVLAMLSYAVVNGQTRIAITNVNIIDVEKGKLMKNQDVVIEGRFITKVTPTGKLTGFSKNELLDGTGKFLMPGLWDMHTHLSYYGEDAFPLLIGFGVMGVRDLGGDLKQIDAWRDEITNGNRIGPLIYRAGPFIDGRKKMDLQRASYTITILTEREAINTVNELKSKIDCIKIHSRVSRDAFFAIAREAKRNDIPLVVHVPVNVTVTEASDSGAWCIEHAESLLGKAIYEKDSAKRETDTNTMFSLLNSTAGDSVFNLLRKNRTWYDPTVIALHKLHGSAYEKALGPRLLTLVSKLHKTGVPLVTGSDFGSKKAGIIPGVDLHEELELFVKAGLTPMQAIQASTIRSAQCLKADKIAGSVRASLLANLILLDKNPLTDIRNTKAIRLVIVNGEILTGNELAEMQKFSRE